MTPVLPNSIFFLVDGNARSAAAHKSQDGFFDGTIWFLVLVPIIAMFVIAVINRKSKQNVREYSDADFDADVIGSETPVLIHLYREWSIGDQVLIAQVETMASRRPPYKVGFVNSDKNEGLRKRFEKVDAPALLFFIDGERVFQSKGVFDAEDVHAELLDLMERAQRNKVTAETTEPIA
ncbi:MAG: thioredoxin 1 [Planctomycetota bacterium]|jgi:thioredoxin 1